MRLLTAAAVTIALALPVSASAKPVLYACDITKVVPKVNWVPEEVYFVVEENGPVHVIDRFLLAFNEGPIAAKVRKRGDKLILTWLLTNIRSENGNTAPPSQYRAELNTKKGSVTVYATSSAFAGAKVRGSGSCKQVKNPKLPKNFR